MILIPSCKKELINAQAHSLLLAADVSDFPLSIAPIMKAMKIMLGYRLIFVTYSTLAEAKHTDIDGICLDMASNDARVIYDSAQDIFYVYYNDTLPKSRVKWNIIHELAHIYLGHTAEKLSIISNGRKISKARSQQIEEEANLFTRCILAPDYLVAQLIYHYSQNSLLGTYVILRSFYRLSQQASYYYACYLTKAPVLHVDKKLIAPFLPYLQRIVDSMTARPSKYYVTNMVRNSTVAGCAINIRSAPGLLQSLSLLVILWPEHSAPRRIKDMHKNKRR